MKRSNKIRNRLIELCNIGGVFSCQEPKFLWPQCPRVATRSMRAAFYEQGLILDHDNTVDLLKNTDDLSDYFIWTFVRDPFDRVVSIKHMPDNINIPWGQWISGLKGRVKESLSQDNPNDSDHKAVVRWVDAKHHFPCSYATHIDGKQFVDFIGRYENIEEDWQRLLIALGIKIGPLSKIGRSNRLTDTYYTDSSAVEAVKSAYTDDLSILYKIGG